jgi:dTDP-4-amino-4,6-dideoxygalactose transaminase
MSNVPLVDLAFQHAQVGAEIARGWQRVLERTAFVLGDEVAEFEQAYAAFVGIDHCIGVGNGTDALELALRALEIGGGDEVIVPANSFIASALAVRRAGATPVFVDADPDHLLIDPESVAARMTARTRAVMPVHLFGQVAPMADITALASDAGCAVVEDAAQAQGATQGGRHAGAFGAIAGTSFYPGKNLGAYGDAGAVMTNDAALAGKVRALRNYGSEVKYHHPEPGFNSRLDTVQAVVLLVKLARLAGWNDERRVAAARYESLLADVEAVRLPRVFAGNEHVWHLYVVRVAERDTVLASLHEQGIGAGIHYPVPIHLQGAFSDLGHRLGDYPVAEAAAGDMLSLPLFPGITADQQERVADALRKAVR